MTSPAVTRQTKEDHQQTEFVKCRKGLIVQKRKNIMYTPQHTFETFQLPFV